MFRFFCHQIIFVIFLAAGLLTELQAESLKKAPSIQTCTGFDFPVARPDADGFYKSRGFREGGHLGEDWISDAGSGNSLGQPVFNIASGIVMLARDIHVAWGNVIIIRHAYLEKGKVQFVDSLYAHLDRIQVKEGALISRGQQIATIGNNHGMYPSHLHFELHKNLNIGVNHTGFAKTLINYWVPTDFIVKRRTIPGSARTVPLPASHFDIPSPWKPRSSVKNKPHKTYLPRTAESKSNSKKINSHFQVNRYTQ